MTSTNTLRLVAAGAFAVAAVAAPFAASALTTSDSDAVALPPGCLAWFGNKEDGRCLSFSNGGGGTAGTPSFGLGPTNPGGTGPGFSTGPLIPGRTINTPIA